MGEKLPEVSPIQYLAIHALFAGSGQTVRQRRYAVTDYGVILWNRTRKFYARRDPPPPGLIPVPSEAAQWRVGDKRTQDRRFTRLLTQKLLLLVDAKLKRRR